MSSAFDMRHSSTSSTSSTSTSFKKARKRRWSREELLKNLSILGPLSAPPEPELPPSPPASRPSSPAPGFKRKAAAALSDHNKRPRHSALPDRSSHQRHAPPPASAPRQSRTATPIFNIRSEPAEEGEVHEETTPSSSRVSSLSVLAATVPIRRPRADGFPSHAHFDEIHRKYYDRGRALKFSGDARWMSSYPPAHRDYKPLPNPPPTGSPYHSHPGVIARLELVDALVCFTYAMWSKEYGRTTCNRETWQTAQAFLDWCKSKWQTSDTQGEKESAFQGLIWMIDGFIHARKFNYAARPSSSTSFGNDTYKLWRSTRESMRVAAKEESLKASSALLSIGSSHLTPQGLPSPANSAPTNSTQSTPSNPGDRTNDSNNTIASVSARLPIQARSPNAPLRALPFPVEFQDKEFPRAPDGGKPTDEMLMAASKVTMPVDCRFINTAQSQNTDINNARKCMEQSQKTLTLNLMMHKFPVTFARMIHSNLAADQEWHPDMEDEEGELFWPSQSLTGEGLGWVCLMGKAMINEMGKEYGYRGLAGIVPKPGQPPVE